MSQSENSDKIYECQTCGKTFNRRTYLQLHEKIHGEKCYKCNICDKSFSQPAGLWIHKKHQSCLKRNSPSNIDTSPCNANGQFDDGKRHKCDICNRRFSQKHLLTYHKRTHTGENPYPCTICGKMFRGTATLKYHERTHTGHKPHKCIFCVKAFTQLGPLRLHCRNDHQSEKIYECEVCKKQFEKFKELSSHKKTHLGASNHGKFPCQTVQRETPSNQVTRDHCQRHGELKVTRYETRSNLSIRSGSGDEERKGISDSEDKSSSGSLFCIRKKNMNSFQSSDTSKSTTYKTRSTTSIIGCMITNHADEQVLARPAKEGNGNPCLTGKKYKCNVCSQEFSHAHVLKDHKRIHTGENPHPCTICGKTFRTPGSLTVHQRTHNGQKPYKCIFCSECFTQRGTLLRHCRRVHFSDQIYECDICKEKFEKYRDLSSHKHVHFDVSCTVVKPLYDKKVDELEPFQGTCLDVVPLISPLNVNMGDCDSNKENNSLVLAERSSNVPHDPNDGHERHSTHGPNSTCEQVGNIDISCLEESLSAKHCIKQANRDSDMYAENDSEVLAGHSCQGGHLKHCTNPPFRAYKELGNMNISFSDESLPVRIKQEREDSDSSNDSGVSPDTSPLDAHVKCDESESDSIYEVYMEPIKMDHEGKDYLSIIGNCPSQTTGNISISSQESQNVPTDGVGKCSKTISDNDELSNCSRVTTPDNDNLFSCCSGDQRNSFFEKKSETSISSQFLHGNHATFTAQLPVVNNQKWKEDHPIRTSNCYLVKNNSADLLPNSIEMGLECSNNMPVHSDVFSSDDNDEMLYSDTKCAGTSNVRELLENQENFTKMNTLPCFQNSITRISDDDNKMNPVPNQGVLEHQCRHRTGIALEDLQQNPKYEYRKTLINGIQYICFKCDVLPASCHLGKQ
ncbi:zinc finger 271-like [Paramuricea clavata]|uniref:Zinc finger 271-like n=1 Tax=Paramuricea clavata TaxID=317549 RepID=A0A6S7HEP6_PARCT|nr:zinc finger 271-like [Paramuricea clavata]